jgi:5,10-methylene-tetrahydrofolate dehydrogenase/methenyl tetrahydrofolate cyclohydrolase
LVQDQELQGVQVQEQVRALVKALEQAQERVQELAAEQVRVLGLAAAQVQGLGRAEVVAEVLQAQAEAVGQLSLFEEQAQEKDFLRELSAYPLVDL